ELLTHIADFTPHTATVSIMRQWHDQLSQWANRPPTTPPSPASRLALELAALLLFAATVIDFFEPTVIGDRLPEAENPESGTKSFATLASARRSLTQSPAISLASTQTFRVSWNL